MRGGCTALFTGFEPFGDERVNPSWEAVQRIPDVVSGMRVARALMPVSYAACGARLDAAIDAAKPDVVICVGQAGGRVAITPECAALNRDHAALPDNEGDARAYAPIREGGAPAFFTNLPVDEMVARLRDAGIPAESSFHAGTYVCNHLYYHLLSRVASIGAPRAGLFVHVPFSSEQIAGRRTAPSLPLDTIVRALVVCAEVVAASL